jgi:hypothetical protein
MPLDSKKSFIFNSPFFFLPYRLFCWLKDNIKLKSCQEYFCFFWFFALLSFFDFFCWLKDNIKLKSCQELFLISLNNNYKIIVLLNNQRMARDKRQETRDLGMSWHVFACLGMSWHGMSSHVFACLGMACLRMSWHEFKK